MTIATFPFTLAAGETLTLTRRGDLVSLLEAAGRVKIWLDDQAPFEFSAGLSLKTPATFDRVRIENLSGAENALELALGFGDLRDARLNVLGGVETTPISPDTFTTGAPIAAADGAATLLAAANVDRAEISLTNDGGDKVYIAGDAGAGAGEGIPLATDATLFLTTTAAVYARNDTGAAVSVAVAELERS